MTVDWVVLTAALCALGVAVVGVVSAGARDPAEGVGARLAVMDVAGTP